MKLRGLCIVCAGILSVCGVATTSAQTKKPDDRQKPKTEIITLSGCVERADGSPAQYTIEDTTSRVKYRLTGTNVRDFVGRPVLIVGGAGSKKLVIAGGLTPNPNVAAQAGAMDPARAAVAAQSGSAGPGTVELPEFKVKSVRPGTGGCR
jgi:hypothetical protein